jgi:hypothetical protein
VESPEDLVRNSLSVIGMEKNLLQMRSQRDGLIMAVTIMQASLLTMLQIIAASISAG